jgi:DNA-binding transcriptional MerR regulator
VASPEAPAPETRAPGTWRVEELAIEAGVSVDTIRFYQKRRLLPAPVRAGRIAWYGPEHMERLGRIRELQARGFSLAVIRRLLDGELDAADEPLAAAVAAAAGASDGDADAGLLTLPELAERVGIPTELLEEIAEEGLLVARRRDGIDRYPASNVELVAAGLRLLDAGMPLPELLELAKRQHETTRSIAEQAVEMFSQRVRDPLLDAPLSDDEKAQRLVESFQMLLPTVTELVAAHFRSVLLEVAQEHLEALQAPEASS